jgi:hypothetical protein
VANETHSGSNCNLDEADLLRAIELIREIFGEQVIVRFVLMLPTGKTGIDLDEDILLSHGIPFMVGEISNV